MPTQKNLNLIGNFLIAYAVIFFIYNSPFLKTLHDHLATFEHGKGVVHSSVGSYLMMARGLSEILLFIGGYRIKTNLTQGKLLSLIALAVLLGIEITFLTVFGWTSVFICFLTIALIVLLSLKNK